MKFLSLTAILLLIAAQTCDARSQFHSQKPSLVALPTKDVTFRADKQAAGFAAKKVITDVKGGDAGATMPMKAAIFNLVKGIVGAGVLSLPVGIAAFGDSQSAVIPAVALITIAGTLSGYNFSLIGRVCAATGATSYSNAWEKSIGEATAWIPAGACTCKTFLAVLAYSMILAETFQGIFQSFGLAAATRTKSLIGLTLTVLLPLCQMKNLASLAPFSLLGIMAMLLTAVAMGLRFFDGSYALPDGKFLEGLAKQPLFGSKGASAVFSPNAFILICMLSTAYMAHFVSVVHMNLLLNVLSFLVGVLTPLILYFHDYLECTKILQ